MRRVVAEFDLFATPALPHEHARELEAIDQILVLNPGIARLIWKDLRGDEAGSVGRPGLSAEQVLRAAIIKQMNGFSYTQLAFHLADSRSYMRFCGFTHPLEVPRKSALADNIKRISAQTWEAINGRVVAYAEASGIEDRGTVRIDPTVVESNIHHPTDNALLFDGVRTLGRILKQARKSFGVGFHDRTRRAKRRHMEIVNAKRQTHRIKPYKDLLKVTRETLRYAEAAATRLRRETGPLTGLAQRLADEIEHYVALVHQVVSQTERRVLHGESVPADEKLVSLFEPHTDIIRKDRRDTYYGHKVTLTGGKSGLILDWSSKMEIPPTPPSSCACSIVCMSATDAIRRKRPPMAAWPARPTWRQPKSAVSTTSSLPRGATSKSRTWPRAPGSTVSSETSAPASRA